MNLKDIKQQLNGVFDDRLQTHQWEKYVNYGIIGLIIISTLQIFLSTYDSIVQQYGTILKWIDYITIVVFSVEVTLRIWCADLLDKKYKGFLGRVRYCFSFYGLLDIVSTYSFYFALFFAIPYNILKVLRVARLLRLFRYMKAFSVLNRAIVNKKDEMVVSLQFLIIVTLMLSFILFFVEHEVQPSVYQNAWNSVLWAFVQYIGDPGNFADTPPITLTGRVIACVIGVLGIAIFAVPAGLIASGFSDAMSEIKREEELESCRDRLRTLFRRTSATKASQKYFRKQENGDVVSKYKFISSGQPVVRLQARQHFDLKDILDTASKYPEFLVKTMSTAMAADNDPEERLIVEHLFINRSYGCFINRKSDVTILSTSNYIEIGTFWFMYYVAKLGGFNFISKHIEVDPDDEMDSFCNFKSEPTWHFMKREALEKEPKKYKAALKILDEKDAMRSEYIEDLKTCCSLCDNPWIVLGIWHIKNKTNTYDFHYTDNKKDGSRCTIQECGKEKYKAFIEAFTTRMQNDFDYKTTRSTRYPFSNNNISYYIQKQDWGKNLNSFALRPSSDILCFSSNKASVAFAFAETIKNYLSEGNKQTEEERNRDFEGLKEGIGYRD